MLRTFRLAIALVLATFVLARPARLAAQEFRVIAHPSVDADALDAPTLARLFLKQATRLPSGKPAVPVDQGVAAAVRAAFSTRILGKRPAAVEQYWQQQVFSGGLTPPVTKDSDDAVIAYVRATPGAVGYIGGGGSAPEGTRIVPLR